MFTVLKLVKHDRMALTNSGISLIIVLITCLSMVNQTLYILLYLPFPCKCIYIYWMDLCTISLFQRVTTVSA